MKYVKGLGLLAGNGRDGVRRRERCMSQIKALSVAAVSCAAALLVIAGSAGATTLTSPTGTGATPTIKGESEGHVRLDLPSTECQWAFEGTVGSHGAGKPVVLPLTSLSMSPCTVRTVRVPSPGELKIDWTSGYNGTVTWNEGTFEVEWLGVVCRYASSNHHFGTITGGSPATIHVDATVWWESGSFACPSAERHITGTIKVTSPSSLFVDS